MEALNFKIVRVDEFRTSVVCCQCKNVGKFVGRLIQCAVCNRERDRDHNTGDNMVRAALSWLRNQVWPQELVRPEN